MSLIPGASEGEVTPPPTPTPGRNVTCEFCECRLAADGSVLKVGAAAKEFRNSDDKIERLKNQIAKLEGDLQAATTENAELRAAAAARKADDDDDDY